MVKTKHIKLKDLQTVHQSGKDIVLKGTSKKGQDIFYKAVYQGTTISKRQRIAKSIALSLMS